MAFEDLQESNYPQTGSAFTISGAGNVKATGSQVSRNADEFIVKDHGASNFGDFDFEFEGTIDATSNGSSNCVFSGLSNTVDDRNNWAAGVSMFGSLSGAGAERIFLADIAAGNDFHTFASNPNDTYFYKFSRSGTSLTGTIYSDSNRTTQVGDVLTLTVATTAYRHYYPGCSFNSGNALHWDGSSENHDLAAAPPAGISIPVVMHHRQQQGAA